MFLELLCLPFVLHEKKNSYSWNIHLLYQLFCETIAFANYNFIGLLLQRTFFLLFHWLLLRACWLETFHIGVENFFGFHNAKDFLISVDSSASSSEKLDEEVNKMCLCYDVGENSQEVRLRQLFQLVFNCPCKLGDLAGIGNILEVRIGFSIKIIAIMSRMNGVAGWQCIVDYQPPTAVY